MTLVLQLGNVQAQSVVKTSNIAPSPFYQYDRIRLVPRTLDSSVCSAATEGLLSVDNDININVCKGSNYEPIIGEWVQSGLLIYPKKTNLNNGPSADYRDLKVLIGDTKLTSIFRFNVFARGDFLAIDNIADTTLSDIQNTDAEVVNGQSRFLWYPKKRSLHIGIPCLEAPSAICNNDRSNDNNIGVFTYVFGSLNRSFSDYSSILGGYYNRIGFGSRNALDSALDLDFNLIGGGKGNLVTSTFRNSSIGGGELNRIDANYGFIGGGLQNRLYTVDPENNDFSSVGSGESNSVHASHSIIFSGKGSLIAFQAPYSVIGGGSPLIILSEGVNKIYSPYAFVSSASNSIGIDDKINEEFDSSYSTIHGGRHSLINGYAGTIGGGHSNEINRISQNAVESGGQYAVISGGVSNNERPDSYQVLRAGDYSTIKGGNINKAIGDYSTVGGGFKNQTWGHYTSIGGGRENIVIGDYSAIVGGQQNIIGSPAIGIDEFHDDFDNSNYDVSQSSFIAGGLNNIINTSFSVIDSAGHAIDISGDKPSNPLFSNSSFNWAGGRKIKLTKDENEIPAVYANRTFVWGYTQTGLTDVATSDAFLIHPKSGDKPALIVGAYNRPADPYDKVQMYVNGGDVNLQDGTLFINNRPGTPGTFNNALQISPSGQIGLDLAEVFITSEEVETGDVLVVDTQSQGLLKKSDVPYDKKVVGIVSQAPAIQFKGAEMELTSGKKEFTKGTEPPVALAGKVNVKVSLENGPIKYGDLLTTSSTSGHAMKADRDRKKSFGKVIGKALSNFDGGDDDSQTGMIPAFVTLQ